MVGFHTLERMATKDKRRGFTLMEMLVVVAIITTLVGIGLNSFSQNIKRARDTKRQAELEQIRGALEMYRSDHLQVGYPANADFVSELVPDYISQIPVDVLTRTSYYYNRTAATAYELCAHLEAPVNPCTIAGTCCVQSCGAANWICNYRVTQP